MKKIKQDKPLDSWQKISKRAKRWSRATRKAVEASEKRRYDRVTIRLAKLAEKGAKENP